MIECQEIAVWEPIISIIIGGLGAAFPILVYKKLVKKNYQKSGDSCLNIQGDCNQIELRSKNGN